MMAQRREAELQEVEEELEEVEDEEDVFDIPAKDPSIQSLREWREASLALNPKRRFRYTTPLRDDLDPRGYVYAHAVKKFRRSALLLRAIHRFRQAGLARRASASEIKFLPPPPGFSIGPDRLARIVQDADFDKLGSLGGVPGVASMLATDLQHGIGGDPQDLQRRKAGFGENKYPKTNSKGLLVFLWEACQDTTLIILMICAIVSLISGLVAEGVEHGWHEGLAIGGSVLFVVLLTGITDYRQSLQFRHLNKEKENIQVQVVRAGRTVQVSIFDLVVGDIVSLNIGGQIPADGVLVSGHSLTLDESSMTGESDPVHKDSNHPFMMSGVKVVDGHGTMMVTGVGMNTEWGQVMATLSDDIGGETPLQVRLSGLATFIGKFGVCVAAIVLCVLIIRYFATKFKKERSAGSVVNDVIDIFSTVVTLVVVAVPEGLPLAVTLTLSYSMSRMMADKSLVRRLTACETMGSATTICSDKTGTLTLNQMSVVKSWVAGHFRDPEEVKAVHSDVYSIVADNIALNSVGSVFTPEDGGEPEVTGSPTEAALLSWGLKVGVNFDVVQSSASILHVETFNSTKKRAGVGVRLGNGNVRAYWKGAAEIILEQCTQWIDDKNQVLPLTPEKVSEIAQLIEGMAAGSLRCVALAYQNIGPEEVPTSEDDSNGWQLPDNNLIFVGVVGIKDPCRPGVREAVAVCQAAGIKVRMVTGDNMVTAKAIAHECGILTADGVAVEGKVFRNYSEEQIFALLPKLDVMARSSPTDKLMLVKMLKKFRANNVVAVTGDGTNDAPALHEADIGLSMGISGTEVAKESSDIIILDDKFTSVVKVVRWGRSVYANIQKYIQFQLTVNVVALSLNLITALSTGEVPLNAVQLLWVNMVMGTLGALALATEPPNNRLMRQRPIGRKDPLVSNAMLRNIVGQATYQILVLLILYYAISKILNFRGTEEEREARRNTIVFNTFVFCQIFNEFNARRPNKMNVFEGITGNHIFLVIIALTIIMQFVIVQYFDDFSGTTNLTWQQWLLCIILGSLSWPLAALVKLIPVRSKPYLTKTAIRRKLRKWKLLKSRRGTGPENGNGDLEQVPQQPSGSVL